MKRETYMYGIRGEKFGIWNASRKEFQFGICEDTPMLAEARLFQRIGDDARKWRFEVRKLPKDLREKLSSQPQDPALKIEVMRKDSELKDLRRKLRAAQGNGTDRPLRARWLDGRCTNCCQEALDYTDDEGRLCTYITEFCPHCGAAMENP